MLYSECTKLYMAQLNPSRTYRRENTDQLLFFGQRICIMQLGTSKQLAAVSEVKIAIGKLTDLGH